MEILSIIKLKREVYDHFRPVQGRSFNVLGAKKTEGHDPVGPVGNHWQWLFGGMGWSLMELEHSLERGSIKWDPLIGGIQTKANLRFLIEVSLMTMHTGITPLPKSSMTIFS